MNAGGEKSVVSSLMSDVQRNLCSALIHNSKFVIRNLKYVR